MLRVLSSEKLSEIDASELKRITSENAVALNNDSSDIEVRKAQNMSVVHTIEL